MRFLILGLVGVVGLHGRSFEECDNNYVPYKQHTWAKGASMFGRFPSRTCKLRRASHNQQSVITWSVPLAIIARTSAEKPWQSRSRAMLRTSHGVPSGLVFCALTVTLTRTAPQFQNCLRQECTTWLACLMIGATTVSGSCP